VIKKTDSRDKNNNTYNRAGTATLSGDLTNRGVINLSNPASINSQLPATTQTAAFQLVNRTLNVQGNYVGGAGSTLNSFINLDPAFVGPQRAGALVVNGTSNGTTAVNLTNVNPAKTGVILGAPIPVISSLGGGTLDSPLTDATKATLAAASNNSPLVQHKWVALPSSAGGGNGWGVSSTLNTGLILSTGGALASALTSIDTSFHQSASSLVASPTSKDPDQWSGGMWARANAGTTTIKSTATDLSGIAGLGAGPTPLSSKTNFAGFQSGLDTGRLNWGNTGLNAHVGISGGEVDANSVTTATGQLGGFNNTTTNVKIKDPFVSVYGVMTIGAFFADFAYRHDFFNTNVFSAGAFGQKVKGDGDNIITSAGYVVQMGSVFVEPSIGMSVSNNRFNDVQSIAPGTPATIKFNDINSELGHLALRVGTSSTVGNLAVQPFVTGSIWHEFVQQATEQFVANANTASAFTVPLAVTRVGTFGQIGVGASAQVLNTGLLGFIRGDARFGEKITGASLVGGGRWTWN